MGSGLFITGTDTGVGKTLVACGLAAVLRDWGYRVGVMKPAETGCEEKDGKLFPQDAFYLKQASGCEEPLERICPYRLRDPLAPSGAAARQEIVIDVSLLAETYREISSAHDVTIVEGAGGLLVPLLPHYTYAELARLLKLPILVVAANRLGAINHLLLTLEHASCRELRVIGYVWNCLDESPSLAAQTNADALLSLTAVSRLGEIPFLGPGRIDWAARDSEFLAALFEDKLSLKLVQSAISL
jgi:dethiobiotin synthetase